MLANGPPCTIAGTCSRVCTRFGFRASFNRAVIAPSAWRSPAVTGFCSETFPYVYPMMILDNLSFRSLMSLARQRTAIISDATVMSYPSSRGIPFVLPPRPSITLRSWRSFISTHLLHVILRGSMFNALPWKMWLSIMAASKLLAAPIAWKSPVKWRLMSSIGTTCAYPPPAAPPLTPNTGPKDGSRRATITLLPSLCIPSARPTVVVVLPSPAGVGLIAVTRINFPSFLSLSFRRL